MPNTQSKDENLKREIYEHVRIMIKEESNHLEEKLVEKIGQGFPEGDALGHRLSHEKAILNARLKNELKEKAMEKVISGTVWSILVGLTIAVYEWFKRQ